MVSAVAAEKHGQTFDFLDANGNGYLQRSDFEAIASRLAEGASASDSASVRDAYLRFWQSLTEHLGIEDDDQITRDQYIESLDAVAKSSPTGFEYFIAQMPRAILAIYDADGDGRLSKKEFLAMQAALGVAKDRARIALLALDRDADGWVGGEDLLASCREFVLSEDVHAPGNWLFGGLKPPPVRLF